MRSHYLIELASTIVRKWVRNGFFNNPELSQKLLGQLVPIIYKRLKATA